MLRVYMPLNNYKEFVNDSNEYVKKNINYGLDGTSQEWYTTGKVTSYDNMNKGKLGHCWYNSAIARSIYIQYDYHSTNQMSIAFWVCRTSGTVSGTPPIVSIGANNKVALSGTNYIYKVQSGYSSLLTTTPTLFSAAEGIWNHVALVFDNSSLKFYLNGELTGTYARSTKKLSEIFASNKNIYFGADPLDNSSYSQYYIGCYNDIRIYDNAISAKEIREIYKGLVAHYSLNDVMATGLRNLYNSSKPLTASTDNGDGSYNIKINRLGNGNDAWGVVSYPVFPFTPEKTYMWYCKIKANVCSSNVNLIFRTARMSNDWDSQVFNAVTYNSKPKWVERYAFKKLSATSIKSGTSYPTSPLLEFYTSNMATDGATYNIDFDIKDVMIVEVDDETPIPYIDNNMISDIVYDCSGLYNNLERVGTVYPDMTSPRYNLSYNFNYTGYFKNDSLKLYTKQFTIAFWAKFKSSISNQHFFMGTFDWWCNNGIGVYRDKGTSNLVINIRSNAETAHKTLTINISSNLGKWTHFAIVYTGTQVIIYIDGIATSTTTTTYGSNGEVYHPVLYLGNSKYSTASNPQATENSESSMSDFRMYINALSAEEISEIATVAGSVDKDGNMYSYSFEEEA